MPPVCCRCNASGSCKNCSCKKANRRCVNCLPHPRDRCANQPDEHPPSPVTDPAPTLTCPTPPLSLYTTAIEDSDDDNACTLPTPTPMANPSFVWGKNDAETFIHSISAAYCEVVHWRNNTFTVPYGNAGKKFVAELSKLFWAYAEGSALESVTLKAITVMSIQLLQKPSRNSKPRDHSACLERRLYTWTEGDINNLVLEGRSLQKHLPKVNPSKKDEKNLARTFSNLIFMGKTGAALQLLSQRGKGGILHANDLISGSDGVSQTVLDALKSKHPQAQPASPEAIPMGHLEAPQVHPVIFNRIDARTICSAALRTKGAAGPSGIDAHCWRRLCTSFKAASNDLCHSLALQARRLCVSFVDPKGLSALMACRLIALDKCPGVRPIGIGETARRIISKAVLFVLKADLQDAAGPLQLCAGQIAGIEAAVHAMRISFQNEDTEAVLLVDASNAFNSLNREVALHNIRHICPSLATILINIYREATELFVDGLVLSSEEGTIQSDPLAMPMYALATIPLINHLSDTSNATQVWYADDASASGRLSSLRNWWDNLVSSGPAFGYHANATKTWLITEDPHLTKARDFFQGTQVNITPQGRPHLGAALGSEEFVDHYVTEKVHKWTEELSLLADVAKTQPHAAYAAYIHGYVHKFSYLCRTVPNIEALLQPLEDCIRCRLIPALTGTPPPNDTERDLLALPVRLGGLGITNPTNLSSSEHHASINISAPLRDLILEQKHEYPFECIEAQINAKRDAHRQNRDNAKTSASTLRATISNSLQRTMDLAQEKGASSWLTALPLDEFGFTLHKGTFRDAIAL